MLCKDAGQRTERKWPGWSGNAVGIELLSSEQIFIGGHGRIFLKGYRGLYCHCRLVSVQEKEQWQIRECLCFTTGFFFFFLLKQIVGSNLTHRPECTNVLLDVFCMIGSALSTLRILSQLWKWPVSMAQLSAIPSVYGCGNRNLDWRHPGRADNRCSPSLWVSIVLT